MSKRALITGITGQDGAYLAQLLLSKHYEVHGMTSTAANPNKLWRLQELNIADRMHLHQGDLQDEKSVNELISLLQPDELYNLGARSFVGNSWQEPLPTADINSLGTLRILEAVRHHSPSTRLYQASTSEMYGNSAQGKMLDEFTPLHPRSPYAISKLFSHWMTINYRESHHLFACCGILFNHESPLRGIEFVTRKITDGVARIALGMKDHVSLGNIDTKRDWGFAGDYVKAMWLMLQQSIPEDFVISTGISHSVRDFLAQAFHVIGIEDYERYIKQDPRYLRPADVEELCGRNEKAKRTLGWEPTVTFQELIHMMVRRDIERLSPHHS